MVSSMGFMSLDIQAVKISQLASCFNLSFQSDTSQAFWNYSLLLARACLFTPFFLAAAHLQGRVVGIGWDYWLQVHTPIRSLWLN